MFTGIIKTVGEIVAQRAVGGDKRLTIATPELSLEDFAEGESICVAGVCLTAIDLEAHAFSADVSVETLAATTLGDLSAGSRVNIEPSLALGERLGGHLVSGHVDGVGQITAVNPAARSTAISITAPDSLLRYVARKGSITVDGISLTVNALAQATFELNIIPHTWQVTTLSDAVVGSRVNLEVDMVARYVERLIGDGSTPRLDKDFLTEHGYDR
ncbi:MAG: riboflavin synthase [Pseudomonadota bacterium]